MQSTCWYLSKCPSQLQVVQPSGVTVLKDQESYTKLTSIFTVWIVLQSTLLDFKEQK